MVKKKEYATVWQLKMMYLFCCMILLASVIFFMVNSVQTDSLQEKIESMPHYECFNETTERWLTLKPRVCWKASEEEIRKGAAYVNGDACSYVDANSSYNPETDKIDCEFGFYTYRGNFRNTDFVSNSCVIKTTKEVCKLNRHDASLGVNE